ncbi:MAG: hypothetical protein QXU75_06995, partial [Candidatus Methanomethylicaceae archaeon]
PAKRVTRSNYASAYKKRSLSIEATQMRLEWHGTQTWFVHGFHFSIMVKEVKGLFAAHRSCFHSNANRVKTIVAL